MRKKLDTVSKPGIFLSLSQEEIDEDEAIKKILDEGRGKTSKEPSKSDERVKNRSHRYSSPSSASSASSDDSHFRRKKRRSHSRSRSRSRRSRSRSHHRDRKKKHRNRSRSANREDGEIDSSDDSDSDNKPGRKRPEVVQEKNKKKRKKKKGNEYEGRTTGFLGFLRIFSTLLLTSCNISLTSNLPSFNSRDCEEVSTKSAHNCDRKR